MSADGWFEGFRRERLRLSEVELFVRLGGHGPPLILLHGYPQTHAMWHRTAPLLAQRFTVICPDLRGYGASDKPPGDPDHSTYSKRRMAQDVVELADALGLPRFRIAGHDRGGRVVHRLCLDHPERVVAAAVLDIVPTATVFDTTDRTLAMGYFHWFFLAQPEPLPERLIAAEPRFWLHWLLGRWCGRPAAEVFDPRALADYERGFDDPAAIHASCEDYRAGATVDLVHHRADGERRISCPLLVLWGEQGLMQRCFDVLAVWRAHARGPVRGRPLPCGHFLPEEAPRETVKALLEFFLELP